MAASGTAAQSIVAAQRQHCVLDDEAGYEQGAGPEGEQGVEGEGLAGGKGVGACAAGEVAGADDGTDRGGDRSIAHLRGLSNSHLERHMASEAKGRERRSEDLSEATLG